MNCQHNFYKIYRFVINKRMRHPLFLKMAYTLARVDPNGEPIATPFFCL